MNELMSRLFFNLHRAEKEGEFDSYRSKLEN